MRAADLLRTQVLRPDGQLLGEVVDIRLEQDGPLLGADCALRIQGFVVGHRRFAAHLGYDRTGVRGPALVAAVVRRLTAGNRYLPWADVAALEDGRIRARVDALGPVPDLAQQAGG